MKVLFCLVLCLLPMANPASAQEKHPEAIKSKTIITTQWKLPDELKVEDLSVRIIQDDHWECTLEFVKDDKTILSIVPKPPFVDEMGISASDLFTLDDGNLATLWKSKIGNFWDLKVYAYSNGSISEVLHTSSQMRPEFVYLSRVPKETVKIIPNLEAGHPDVVLKWRQLKQAIIIAHPEKKALLVPKAVDIYEWDAKSKTYIIQKNVPWQQRLK